MIKYILVFLFVFLLFPVNRIFSFNGPLKVSTQNSRYFTDNSEKIIYLAGLHTWRNFQSIGNDNFNYSSYLDYLVSNNLNFTRLWIWENFDHASGYGSNVVSPLPFQKSSTSSTKYDLNTPNQQFYDRLKQHVQEAYNKNIYVTITLFNGWSVGIRADDNPYPYHPFNSNNNINGVNGDYSPVDSNGYEIHSTGNSTINVIQEAYVKKVIDTVNEFDNVMFEICNECSGGTAYNAWQKNMINLIHNYESTKPKKHVVGFTNPYSNTSTSELFNSNADYISPGDTSGYQTDPALNDGRKVVIADTDHLWGLGGDRTWAWKSFTRGVSISYMDCYAQNGSLEAQLSCPISFNDSTRTSLVKNMGYIKTYSNKLNNISTVPSSSISSTTYALINGSDQYLIYQPGSGAFTVNLSTNKTYSVEWLNPSNGNISTANNIIGGVTKTFTPPFSGDAVLFLQSTVAPSPTNTPTIPFVSPTLLVTPTINSKFDVNKDGAVNLLDVFVVLNEIFK